MIKKPTTRPRFRPPSSRYTKIGQEEEDPSDVLHVPQDTASKFNILTSGSCVSVLIWLALVSVFVVVVVVIAVVPNYGGGIVLGPTTTYPPLSSTTPPTTTTTTTTIATTTPPPPLIFDMSSQ